MNCLPTECEWCEPWGASVPNKAKCRKPPLRHYTDPSRIYQNGWRYSTTLGGSCATHGDEQMALFDMAGDDDSGESDPAR